MAFGAIAGALTGGATLAQGLLAARGGKRQREALREGQGILKGAQEQTEEQLDPFADIGRGAFDQIAAILGIPNSQGVTPDGRDFSGFFKSPGFQFRLNEGIKGVERSGAARGLLQSGRTFKDVQRFGEGLASSEFNNFFNQLFATSQAGQGAATNIASLGERNAERQAGILTGIGQSRFNQARNIGNALVGGAQGFASLGGQGLLGGGRSSAPIPPIPSFDIGPPPQTNFGG